eukprot:TRINITY_DN5930_c0_g2_i1.p1 TRINITY_DN5930_c0_g2~~TRINITY_DN5930_c0_g2_i1.p1  ORF type:complete len:283 (-),score=13.75 TRINITY_DN5930_c0_g2_i1:24-872(-)
MRFGRLLSKHRRTRFKRVKYMSLMRSLVQHSKCGRINERVCSEGSYLRYGATVIGLSLSYVVFGDQVECQTGEHTKPWWKFWAKQSETVQVQQPTPLQKSGQPTPLQNQGFHINANDIRQLKQVSGIDPKLIDSIADSASSIEDFVNKTNELQKKIKESEEFKQALKSVENLKHTELFAVLVKQCFQECDYDGDGYVEERELYIGLLLLYDKINYRLPCHIPAPGKEAVKYYMQTYDVNHDGRLDADEFMQVALTLFYEADRSESTRLNSSHEIPSRMPSSA